MPIYLAVKDSDQSKIIIEAKSALDAKLHLVRDYAVMLLSVKELAALVREGVKIESAGKDAEAAEASLRG